MKWTVEQILLPFWRQHLSPNFHLTCSKRFSRQNLDRVWWRKGLDKIKGQLSQIFVKHCSTLGTSFTPYLSQTCLERLSWSYISRFWNMSLGIISVIYCSHFRIHVLTNHLKKLLVLKMKKTRVCDFTYFWSKITTVHFI